MLILEVRLDISSLEFLVPAIPRSARLARQNFQLSALSTVGVRYRSCHTENVVNPGKLGVGLVPVSGDKGSGDGVFSFRASPK